MKLIKFTFTLALLVVSAVFFVDFGHSAKMSDEFRYKGQTANGGSGPANLFLLNIDPQVFAV